LVVLALAVSCVFLVYRALAIFELFQKGLRRDAVTLLAIRDLSLPLAVLCGVFLVAMAICNFKRFRRTIIALLVLSALSCGMSAYAEAQLRTRVSNNFRPPDIAPLGYDGFGGLYS